MLCPCNCQRPMGSCPVGVEMCNAAWRERRRNSVRWVNQETPWFRTRSKRQTERSGHVNISIGEFVEHFR